MSDEWSRDDVLEEMQRIEGDLAAFRRAMNAMSDRKEELAGDPNHQKMFLEWPATQAILNVLIMAITRCEGLLEDHRRILEGMDAPDNLVLLEKKT